MTDVERATKPTATSSPQSQAGEQYQSSSGRNQHGSQGSSEWNDQRGQTGGKKDWKYTKQTKKLCVFYSHHRRKKGREGKHLHDLTNEEEQRIERLRVEEYQSWKSADQPE